MCCENPKIVSVSGKCADLFNLEAEGVAYKGYVPGGIGIGSGDYITFSYCLSCGKIQDDFPKELILEVTI